MKFIIWQGTRVYRLHMLFSEIERRRGSNWAPYTTDKTVVYTERDKLHPYQAEKEFGQAFPWWGQPNPYDGHRSEEWFCFVVPDATWGHIAVANTMVKIEA